MSDINDLIHSNARVAFDQGVKTEQQRILTLLQPLAKHDEEMCYNEGKLQCWPEDCNADIYISAIRLIKGEYSNRLIKGEQK
jgi:hypothetical protein